MATPMTEPAFLVLTAALVGSPRHGYGIVSEIEDLSEGRVRLRVGTLYGGLERGPRPKVWWDAWRRIALVGLLANTIWSTSYLLILVWFSGVLPGVPVPDDAFWPGGDWLQWWGNLAWGASGRLPGCGTTRACCWTRRGCPAGCSASPLPAMSGGSSPEVAPWTRAGH
jgi:hypothetical protein